jgi:hypothetical protein
MLALSEAERRPWFDAVRAGPEAAAALVARYTAAQTAPATAPASPNRVGPE